MAEDLQITSITKEEKYKEKKLKTADLIFAYCETPTYVKRTTLLGVNINIPRQTYKLTFKIDLMTSTRSEMFRVNGCFNSLYIPGAKFLLFESPLAIPIFFPHFSIAKR